MSKLSLEGVSKSYAGHAALHPTSLAVQEGEFLTLLGPSGSGKSTLLSIIAGLSAPDRGRIRIDGIDVTEAPANARDIGMVFQNYALFPHLTVFENVAFPLRMRKRPAREITAEVTRILGLVHLEKFADRLTSELSGGQQQRVAFARCAIYRPSIILMDEPLGALDKKLRDHMQGEIRSLHKDLGTTIVYVTHDQEEAFALSDRICLMAEGAVAQLGTPRDLYFEPASDFVADFFGATNILVGHVESREGRPRLVCGQQDLPLCENAAQSYAAGAKVAAVLRPQDIRLAPGEGGGGLGAKVVSRILIGNVVRTVAMSDSGYAFTVLELSGRDGLHLPPGAPVRLEWSPTDISLTLPRHV